jgi:hypothetical protein
MFGDLILTIAEEIAISIKDCLTHDLANQHGKQRLASLGRNNMVNNYCLTVVRVYISSYTSEAKLTIEGDEGNGVLSLGSEESTFTDNRKVVLLPSQIFPLPLRPSQLHLPEYKITICLTPDPVNPFYLRNFHLPTPEEEEIVPKKHVPPISAPSSRTYLGIQTTSDANWATIGRPPMQSHPT